MVQFPDPELEGRVSKHLRKKKRKVKKKITYVNCYYHWSVLTGLPSFTMGCLPCPTGHYLLSETFQQLCPTSVIPGADVFHWPQLPSPEFSSNSLLKETH